MNRFVLLAIVVFVCGVAAQNTTTAAPTVAATTTVAVNSTNATNATTAPTVAPITPTPTKSPFANGGNDGNGTYFSSQITITMDIALSAYNEAVFKQRAGAVVGLPATDVIVDSVRAGSVITVFRLKSRSQAVAAVLARNFKQLIVNNQDFQATFPVTAVDVDYYNGVSARVISLALALVAVIATLF